MAQKLKDEEKRKGIKGTASAGVNKVVKGTRPVAPGYRSKGDIISHYNGYYKSATVKLATIRKGLEANALNDLISLTGVTKVDLAHILSLTEPTLRKYIKEGKQLNQGVTEHVIQLFELFDKGMDTFGSLEEFKNWLPHHNIGINARPVELLDTITGINIVMDELLRIDYGVLA